MRRKVTEKIFQKVYICCILVVCVHFHLCGRRSVWMNGTCQSVLLANDLIFLQYLCQKVKFFLES